MDKLIVLYFTLFNINLATNYDDFNQSPPLLQKMRELAQIPTIYQSIANCKSNINTHTDGANCIFNALGLNQTQTQFLINLSPYNKSCKSSLTQDFNSCINNLDLRNRYICYEMRNEEVKSLECLANKASLKNFKAKSAIYCYRNCKFESVGDVFNCEFNCKKSIYNGLGLFI